MRAADKLSPRGGIVRHARRPAGWRPPGPPAAPPADPSALWPGPGEDLCWLSGDWRILQRTDGHRFSLDDILTAAFAAQLATATPMAARATASATATSALEAATAATVAGTAAPVAGTAPTVAGTAPTVAGTAPTPSPLLDLGCGIGTVLLLLTWRFPAAVTVGIEAQPISAALARRSIAWNGVADRCRVIEGDLRDPDLLPASERFPLVTGTPPYFPRGTGVESQHLQRGPCRFEHRGGIEDYARAAARHLAPEGRFVACAPAGQATRVADAAAAAGLAIERWRDIIPRAGKPPLLSLFSLRSPRTEAPTLTDAPLLIRDATGRRTEAFIALRQDLGMPP